MSDNKNLPLHMEDGNEMGTITYANEVIAIIAGMATNEVEGVVNTTATTTGIADLFARSKPVTRGVKVEVGTEEASVDIVLNVEYGKPIQKVCTDVQENVRKAIETMTGLHVLRVDVHVTGISFEKETKEINEGYVRATEPVEDEDFRDIDDANAGADAADVDSPPEGVDPDDLPVRNVAMNDMRMEDDAEEASATLSDDADDELDEEETP